MDWQLLAQACALLGCIAYHSLYAILSLPGALMAAVGISSSSLEAEDDKGKAVFYEGKVFHIRRQPKENSFT